ncbi:hypothetical protein NDU88_000511 [Pleurodeles waltl]|uniref:KRAB domain-containing protein n=1 Tax=Pleurodeles waltl TaxID=8319 RepID=A0AAV7NGA8_PLEWA|nr:hypothetical protein NDU88_000511 [Pleurodeles waltl]
MSHREPKNALLTFQDVVAGFSQVEFELLHSWQSDLYANLMKEVHQAFLSLGPVISNFVFSLKEKEGLVFVDDDSDKGHRPNDIVATAVISQSFTGDNKKLFKQESENEQRNTGHIITTVISQSFIDENKALFHQGSEDEQGNAGDSVAKSVISESFIDDNRTLFKQESEDEHGNAGYEDAPFGISQRFTDDNKPVFLLDERGNIVHGSETGHMSDKEAFTCSLKELSRNHASCHGPYRKQGQAIYLILLDTEPKASAAIRAPLTLQAYSEPPP